MSDDELVLLDVMFDGRVPLRLLFRNGFSAQFNRSPHELDEQQLRHTLRRFVDDGSVDTEQHGGDTCYGLTPTGGQLWEAERLPAWDRYASDRYGETPSGKPFLTITATRAETRDDFWNIGREAGLFAHSDGRVETATLVDDAAIPWKTFPELHVLVALLDDRRTTVDWPALEARRTWWRNAVENERFWPSSKP